MKRTIYILLLLIVVSCLLRLGTFDEPCMNVDEASNATYVMYYTEEGIPLWRGVTPLLLYCYRLAYVLGGDYNQQALRFLGALIVGLSAFLLFLIYYLGRKDFAGALLAALIYELLMISRRWEGFAINSELLANLFLLLALLCVLHIGKKPSLLFYIVPALLSGISFGLAYEAKSHCLPFALFFVIAIASRIIPPQTEQQTFFSTTAPSSSMSMFAYLQRLAAALCAFALPAFLLIQAPHILSGRFSAVLSRKAALAHQAVAPYVEGGIPSHEYSLVPLFVQNVLLKTLPSLPWVLTYLMLIGGALCLALTLLNKRRPQLLSESRLNASQPGLQWQRLDLIFTVYFAVALFTLSLGLRFFAHYFIFALPAVAYFSARALSYLWSFPVKTYQEHRKNSFLRRRGLQVAVVILSLWFIADSLILSYALDLQPTVTFRPPLFKRVAETILEKTDDNDRIYVWGYSPDLYLYTQRLAASRLVVPQQIVSDYGQRETPRLNRRYLGIMFQDFENHPPALFIDVSRVSFSLAELKMKHKTRVYDIELIPELRDYLEEHFERIGSLDQVTFYQWKSK